MSCHARRRPVAHQPHDPCMARRIDSSGVRLLRLGSAGPGPHPPSAAGQADIGDDRSGTTNRQRRPRSRWPLRWRPDGRGVRACPGPEPCPVALHTGHDSRASTGSAGPRRCRCRAGYDVPSSLAGVSLSPPSYAAPHVPPALYASARNVSDRQDSEPSERRQSASLYLMAARNRARLLEGLEWLRFDADRPLERLRERSEAIRHVRRRPAALACFAALARTGGAA